MNGLRGNWRGCRDAVVAQGPALPIPRPPKEQLSRWGTTGMRARWYSKSSPAQVFRGCGRLLFLRNIEQIRGLLTQRCIGTSDVADVCGVSWSTAARWLAKSLTPEEIAGEIAQLERTGCEELLDQWLEEDLLVRKAITTIVAIHRPWLRVLDVRYVRTVDRLGDLPDHGDGHSAEASLRLAYQDL